MSLDLDLATGPDLDALLNRAVRETARLLDASGAIIYLYDREQGHLRWAYDAGISDERELAWVRALEFPLGIGMYGMSVERGVIMVTDDYAADPRFVHTPALDRFVADVSLRSMIVAPMIGAAGPLGALGAYSRRPAQFDEANSVLITALAGHAALAIENARLLAEQREAIEQFRALTENSPDVVWALDLEDRFTFVSSRIESFTGHSPSDYIGRPLIDVVHDDTRAALAARLARVNADIAGGRIDPAGERHYRFSLAHVDGSPISVELRSIGIVVDGALRGWQGSVRDMRSFDRLERDLRESEARYRLLTERTPDLIVAVDAEARITFVSGRSEALIGWTPGDLAGRYAVELVHPDSIRSVEARWAERLRNPEIEQLHRVTIKHRDGRSIPVEMRSVGIVVDGQFRGEQSSLRDMTERDRMERELRRHAAELAASQERAHLAQELHDSVTQALFSMTLTTRAAEMLLRKDPDAAAEKLAELRELGKDALTEMRSLIFELRPGSLEQDGLVTALRKHAAAVQGRTGLPVLVEIDECPRLPLEIEEGMYRIAQEALHNVVKHARATHVRIDVAAVEGGVRMRVEDDGRGFDAGNRPEGGHLGLTGMAARAERVGATFVVRSRLGQGTTVEVMVPVFGVVPKSSAPFTSPVPAHTHAGHRGGGSTPEPSLATPNAPDAT